MLKNFTVLMTSLPHFPREQDPPGAVLSKRLRLSAAASKLGGGLGFTGSQVRKLQEASSFSRSGSIPSARLTGSSAGQSKGSQYSKALELLTGTKPTNVGESVRPRSISS